MDRLADRVRELLRAEKLKKHLSEREMSELLGGVPNGWSHQRIGKILSGETELGVNEMETLCFALGLTPVEAVRDHGLEFVAEMTPTELRVLEEYRRLPEAEKNAFNTLLRVRARPYKPQRFAKPLPQKKLTQR